eukprot:gnl/MRDRNA2_/MRDRNA2_30088_c0_seq2.p1 gnl/MRDRNA2_/MRDRNA2_30088_c0~~gnl/MRDRNA2_/MRDRNA2_30088_c0_seq2.p1  ORF type:complete len:180 (-),score=22.26 gnl/MRDRNA2_/MRDRNA2_30088_c0_seq2:69-608(-)
MVHSEAKGLATSSAGNRYTGDFLNGKQHGRGTMLLRSGNRYEGDFRHGEMHGEGTLVFKTGNRYEGQFFQGHMHGLGVMRFKDGTSYEGEFCHDRMVGRTAHTGALAVLRADHHVSCFPDDNFSGRSPFAGTYPPDSVPSPPSLREQFQSTGSGPTAAIEPCLEIRRSARGRGTGFRMQ